jgi:hypothetical protein
MNLLDSLAIVSAMLLVGVLINLIESSSYMYPLTIYAPEIVKELLLNSSSTDNEYLDRTKAVAFVFAYAVFIILFNVAFGHVFGHFCHLLSIKYARMIIMVANLLLFSINLCSFITLVKNNTHSSFIIEDSTMNTTLGIFFMLMERMIPQMIGVE